jgi:hypothetical protein
MVDLNTGIVQKYKMPAHIFLIKNTLQNISTSQSTTISETQPRTSELTLSLLNFQLSCTNTTSSFEVLRNLLRRLRHQLAFELNFSAFRAFSRS